jgi:Ca2+-binding RTX toxin-like protein
MSRASCIASVFGLGVVVLMLAASPAAAINTCPTACHCAVDCSQTCVVGTVQEGFETLTCEEVGRCIGSPACTGSSCPAVACGSTINGTSGGDTLNGGSGHECINGFGGDDTITGNAGDDTISAGDGNDTVYGGSGNDCLYGDNGSDNVNGDSGTDLCDGETEATCEL